MARRWFPELSLCTAMALAIFAPTAVGQTESGEKIYQRTLRGTTWIIGIRNDGTVSGTGALVDLTHRWVLTNFHVAGEANRVLVLFPHFRDGKLIAERSEYQDLLRKSLGIPAKVVYRDQRRDLVLLELESVPRGAEVIHLARTSPSPGQRVHSVGNPGKSGALWLYTQGTVRQVYEKKWRVRDANSILEFSARVVETQSPTNPGDSGGPLVNDHGDLVGVTQGMAADASLLSLFIDVSEVKAFLATNKVLSKLPPTPKRGAGEERARSDPETKSDKPAEEPNFEVKASTLLSLAKSLADEGKLERAKMRYEEIVLKYPKTKAASEAKELLNRLNK